LADALRDSGVPHHAVRMGQWRKAKYWIRIPHDLRKLRHIAKHEHAQLVHCNEPHSAPYGLHAAKRRGIPCAVHIRLDNVDARLIRNYHLDRADCIVAVSRAVANQITHICPTLHERVTVVPNGVDADALRTAAPIAAAWEPRTKTTS
jgi:glycosyltransferase involved in cell wall biosynthesis